MSEIILNSANFEQEVLKSDLPVMVDFWAEWCGPCRMLAPAVSEIAKEYAGQVKVGKVNVDEQPALANEYGISSIPSVLLFKGGKVVSSSVGLKPKAQLEAMLK